MKLLIVDDEEITREGLINSLPFEEIGITDDAVIQMRQAVYRVSTGQMTIDEAVKAYGTFEQ